MFNATGNSWGLLDLSTRQMVPGIVPTVGDEGQLVRFSDDSRFLTVVDASCVVQKYDLRLVKLVSQVKPYCAVPLGNPLPRAMEGDVGVTARGNLLHVWQASTGAPYISMANLNGRLLYISPDGHYRGPEGIEEELVYVVLTEEGQQLTFTPQEFSAKYGWKNDPSRVGKAP